MSNKLVSTLRSIDQEERIFGIKNVRKRVLLSLSCYLLSCAVLESSGKISNKKYDISLAKSGSIFRTLVLRFPIFFDTTICFLTH